MFEDLELALRQASQLERDFLEAEAADMHSYKRKKGQEMGCHDVVTYERKRRSVA